MGGEGREGKGREGKGREGLVPSQVLVCHAFEWWSVYKNGT